MDVLCTFARLAAIARAYIRGRAPTATQGRGSHGEPAGKTRLRLGDRACIAQQFALDVMLRTQSPTFERCGPIDLLSYKRRLPPARRMACASADRISAEVARTDRRIKEACVAMLEAT